MVTSDQMVVWSVVLGRFLLPLTIPRYPLPGIVASMLLDAADYKIFDFFTDLPIEHLTIYQNYDKSLDIYYLSIAYVSMFRNWTNPFAFKLGRFFFFYRLAGGALFELTQIRAVLLIFPNVFEYFFVAYEAFRMRQDPLKLTKRKLIIVAVFIWIFIKLPQEFWIHIIQPEYPDLPNDHPWTYLIAAAWFAVIAIFAWLQLRKKQPGREVSFAADPTPADLELKDEQRNTKTQADRFADRELIEKIVLISFLSITYAQVLPGIKASNIQIAIGVALLILINTSFSQWLSSRGKGWISIFREFSIMVMANLSLILAASFLLPRIGDSIDIVYTMFFVLLLLVNITLYDQYRQVYLRRLAASG